MAVAAEPRATTNTEVGDKGLKSDAIGYLSNLVIGVASTAPAYSLAATLGFIVAVPESACTRPAILLVSFFPMLLIAYGYKYLNKADPDCGTTFAWATRALGPYMGFINGWAIFVADVIVMASLSVIASTYTYRALRLELRVDVDAGDPDRLDDLDRADDVDLLPRHRAVGPHPAGPARCRDRSSSPRSRSSRSSRSTRTTRRTRCTSSADWFNPFAIGIGPLADGLLLGIFIYWGWDSGVSVNEETESSADAPGKAAVVSTLILAVHLPDRLGAATQAYAGTGFLIANSERRSAACSGTQVFGSPWDKLLIVAVLTSASASTQTTILPTARTTLSMARWKAIPPIIGRIHPKYLTPTCLDPRDGRALDRLDAAARRLRLVAGRARRLDHCPRLLDPLLLRLHRPRLRRLLPAGS